MNLKQVLWLEGVVRWSDQPRQPKPHGYANLSRYIIWASCTMLVLFASCCFYADYKILSVVSVLFLLKLPDYFLSLTFPSSSEQR